MGAKKKQQSHGTNTASVAAPASDEGVNNGAGSSAYAQLSFNDVLEDLSSRFIVNLPSEEQTSIERICFQVEQAHWFYEDFLRPLNPSLPSLALRRFSSFLLHAAALTVPLIQKYIATSSSNQQGLDVAFDEFLSYKTRVPVCGAVMLNNKLNKCVLVKGWKASAAWGFPKGKINQQESERDCAVREVYEETGFDCDPLVSADSTDFIECTMRNQRIRLYIVPGLDENTQFETQTRKEISKIAWFNLSDLPTWKENKAPPQGMGGKFYLISPFVGMLKKWIQQNRAKYKAASASNRRGAVDLQEEDVYTGDEDDTQPTLDRSGDLKALLGVGPTMQQQTTAPKYADVVNGKGTQMIEEQGDARGRQLLDLLRGAPSSSNEYRAGTPVQNFGGEQGSSWSLDDRERGTATLLAALNAGSGKPIAGNELHGDGASLDLLSLLNGSSSSERIDNNNSPLPAPRAQRTAQAQSLLNLISPSTSMSFSDTQPNAASSLPGVGYSHNVQTTNTNDAERERAQKRDALLSNLLFSSLNINAPQQIQQHNAASTPAGHPYPPPPPLSTYHYAPAPQPQPPTAHQQPFAYPPPLSFAATQSPSGAYDTRQPNRPDVAFPHQAQATSRGGNTLLSLLNAGPSAPQAQYSYPPGPVYATAQAPHNSWPLPQPPMPPQNHQTAAHPSYAQSPPYTNHYPASPYPPPPPPPHTAVSPNAYYASGPPPPTSNGQLSA